MVFMFICLARLLQLKRAMLDQQEEHYLNDKGRLPHTLLSLNTQS